MGCAKITKAAHYLAHVWTGTWVPNLSILVSLGASKNFLTNKQHSVKKCDPLQHFLFAVLAVNLARSPFLSLSPFLETEHDSGTSLEFPQ